jgi:hypothetical protein
MVQSVKKPLSDVCTYEGFPACMLIDWAEVEEEN